MTLLVLRGNSGSGKSTIARMLQTRLSPDAAWIEQDWVRRIVLAEKDRDGALNGDLIESMATFALDRGRTVIVDGILNAARYAANLERLAHGRRALFYAFDLSFEETLRRHALRSADGAKLEFGEAQMRGWYHGWQPLPFVEERRIAASESADAIVTRILGDLVA